MSTLTKLQIVNNALNSIGERSLASVGGILGNMVEASLREAIFYVCDSHEWTELHSVTNAVSWSADSATMPDRTYRIREMYWYLSPDGMPEASYDYNKTIVPFISYQEYESEVLYPFTDNAARPLVWTKLTDQIVKVNPYPNNATERSRAFFSIYRYPQLPTGDTDTFSTGDLLTNLIQYKCAEILALKHLNDFDTAGAMNRLYMDMSKSHFISDSGTPSYTMYRGGRR